MNSRKIGALWIKTSKAGNQFWSGELVINGRKFPIVAFNREKKHDKEPDIDILKSQEQEGLIVEE
jgi:uncharacterized protein (DUF736 family)